MEDVDQILDKILRTIKEERRLKGWSHENIAHELKISPSAYNKLERRETKLTLQRFLQLQHLLQIPISELFDTDSSVMYNQEIKDNGIGHQQVQNLYQENREISEKFIASLQEEIRFLKAMISAKAE